MGRRISDSDPNGKKPCAFCRTMRVVVMFAVVMVMLMAYADKLHWLEDIPFTNLFGYLIAVAFLLVLGYRYWDEYWRPKQDSSARDARRSEQEKKFDELDAIEAERAVEAALTKDLETEQGPLLEPEVAATLSNDQESVPESAPEQLDLLGFEVEKPPK
ncbi:MAG: hypothetical protein HOH02_11565 [Oceanospirillaceae bacterium]|jgi:hypothetical protein|nr:hypothetical protein [Oceanospirillaceae bacterium]MBT4442696.1 hypothetical protein [Oceanospirillaceae bacterium]MBT6078581.1 hypothetical protein [Oceanospirillaceae bacterium]